MAKSASIKSLVIEARGLPAGFLGCYGNEWIGTPCLDRLACRGIVFDAHIADRPELHPAATTSRAVGLESLTYARIDSVVGFARSVLTVWRQAPQHGIVWIDGPNLAPPWFLPGDLLASYFDDDGGDEPWPDPPLGIWPKVEIGELLRLHNTFAVVATYFDAQVAALLEELPDDVLLCVTARSGLPLGEHGLVGGGRAWLHEELVHVPLVMVLPGRREAGRRIAALTQPSDLLPTLVALVGLDAGQGETAAGRPTLVPLLHGEAETVRPYAASELTVGDSSELALRTPDWAMIVPTSIPAGDPPRGPRLYVKPDDRWEVNDVRQHHLEFAEALESILHAFREANRQPGPPVYPPLPPSS